MDARLCKPDSREVRFSTIGEIGASDVGVVLNFTTLLRSIVMVGLNMYELWPLGTPRAAIASDAD